MRVIRSITKKELCVIFGLQSVSGRCYYTRLRQIYFTPEAMERLKITPERYLEVRGGKCFDYFETQRICDLYEIREEDLAIAS